MEIKENEIYCVDCYKAIKDIPDKSVDCIYVDIPYLYNQGGSGNSELGERTAKKRLELDVVLDCFMGSGSTCVACKDIGRKYIGFEISEKWFKVAQDRLSNVDATGQFSMFTF